MTNMANTQVRSLTNDEIAFVSGGNKCGDDRFGSHGTHGGMGDRAGCGGGDGLGGIRGIIGAIGSTIVGAIKTIIPF